MNKMERPMMTIVRFGAEDVIATSSRVISGLYSALGSEIQEYAHNAGTVDDTDYPLNDLGANNLYNVAINNQGVVVADHDTNEFFYAWYNETSGFWYTENEPASTYGNNLPK